MDSVVSTGVMPEKNLLLTRLSKDTSLQSLVKRVIVFKVLETALLTVYKNKGRPSVASQYHSR